MENLKCPKYIKKFIIYNNREFFNQSNGRLKIKKINTLLILYRLYI